MLLNSKRSASHTSRTSNLAVFTLAQVFFSRETGLMFMPASDYNGRREKESGNREIREVILRYILKKCSLLSERKLALFKQKKKTCQTIFQSSGPISQPHPGLRILLGP